MNVNDYISSGIVDSYVWGLANEADTKDVLQKAISNPEIAALLHELEIKLERFDMANAVPPPAGLRESVFRKINAIKNHSSNHQNIITMNQYSSQPARSGGSRFLVAACIVLLLGLAYLSYQFYTQKESLEKDKEELQAKLTTSDSILNKIAEEQKMVSDPNVTVVNMVGTQVAPRSSANIYWDSTSSSVFLVVKNMPKLTSDKQYQLWALIDGKPKDLGVFDVNDEKVILKMKNTQKAEAFAITIEEKGGKPSPTLEKMQSMGKTKAAL